MLSGPTWRLPGRPKPSGTNLTCKFSQKSLMNPVLEVRAGDRCCAQTSLPPVVAIRVQVKRKGRIDVIGSYGLWAMSVSAEKADQLSRVCLVRIIARFFPAIMCVITSGRGIQRNPRVVSCEIGPTPIKRAVENRLYFRGFKTGVPYIFLREVNFPVSGVRAEGKLRAGSFDRKGSKTSDALFHLPLVPANA